MCNDWNDQIPDALARFLNLMRPKVILVVNSMIGLDVVALYGRGLSQFAKISCAFFSLGLHGRFPTYGAIYARRVLPFATLLTDNKPPAPLRRATIFQPNSGPQTTRQPAVT